MSLGLLGYRGFGGLGKSGGSGSPRIAFPSVTITTSYIPTEAVGGTATIVGHVSGVSSWSLTNNASGTYAIGALTGIVTIASTAKLAAEIETITIAVTGVAPTVTAKSFQITVNSSGASANATWPGILIEGF
jgi:Tfp pilus assembly protein PilX